MAVSHGTQKLSQTAFPLGSHQQHDVKIDKMIMQCLV